VNQTIIPCDPAGSKSVDEVVSHNLAKKVHGFWYPGQKEPITYYEYIYDYKYGKDRKDKLSKKLKIKDLGAVVDHLYEVNHPQKWSIKEKFYLSKDRLKKAKTLVLPAFYEMVNFLEIQNISYSLVLRSFGSDLDRVKKEIESMTRIRFLDSGHFENGVLYMDSGRVISSPLEMTEMFKKGHFSLQDNYAEWNAHDESGPYGKKLPLDGSMTFFFDDHISTDPTSPHNIVAPMDAYTNVPLDPFALVDTGVLVPVNVVDVILDTGYFVKKIRSCCDKQRQHLQALRASL